MPTRTAFRPDPAIIRRATVREGERRSRQSDLLGQPVCTDYDIVKVVANGLDPGVITRLTNEGLTRRELEFVIPPRTLTHRIKNGERLSTDESERSVRLVNLLLQAEQLLGGKEAATAWLRQPLRRFDGRSALEVARTEQGARLVEELLIQIEEGYVA
ncbi:antitoxin Xre/MbcA/ParS toxin-binding domain-containing protein [Chromobacterium sphagni]|uniref:antitoxin Xre/MbcA/ParS toxin-binding domain-containing protein n=1 Tax=Chromobacterium sphagni TaxID=1903179 RepID=UPI000B0F01BD|nr:antitoxin Xre/MbcA/ParS toxin-binding domain-containing protein [Chromobacterium sphagni]